jgi:hypothetical protein
MDFFKSMEYPRIVDESRDISKDLVKSMDLSEISRNLCLILGIIQGFLSVVSEISPMCCNVYTYNLVVSHIVGEILEYYQI